MTELILHIGLPRTASTSIQQALLRSRRNLLKHGVLYPKTGLFCGAHHSIGWAIAGKAIENWSSLPDFKRLIHQLTKEIRSSRCDSVIISTETLARVAKQPKDGSMQDRLLELLALFTDVKVLCCVRHQASLMESWYRFVVGWDVTGLTQSFEDHVMQWTLSEDFVYSKNEGIFRALRPDISFQYFSFSEAIVSGSIVQRFFQLAGIADIYQEPIHVNKALSREAALAVLEWNRETRNQRSGRKFFVAWAVKNFPEARHSLYEPELLARVINRFQESNQALEESAGIRFLDTPDLTTFAPRCFGHILDADQFARIHEQISKVKTSPWMGWWRHRRF